MCKKTQFDFKSIKRKRVMDLLTLLPIALIVFFLNAAHSFAGVSPRDILRHADRARGNLEGVEWRVYVRAITKGTKQKRNLNVKARSYDFLAIMTAPPKVKNNKLLMVDRNMWFTRPNLRKPVPVSSRQKLIGAASYGDIAATNYADDYEATRLRDQLVDGELCYVFDLLAKTKKATYDRIKYWVSKKRIVGVRAHYYTVSGKMFKWATFKYANQILLKNKGHPFISRMKITDALVRGDMTTMDFSKPRLVKVPPSALDVNLLQVR